MSSRRDSSVTTPMGADGVSDGIFYGSNPYDAHGPYDDDYRVAGPSRQAPMPYDDPYAEYPPPDTTDQELDKVVPTLQSQECHPSSSERRPFEPRRRARSHRGRGHGREGNGHRGRMPRGRPGHYQNGSIRQEASGPDMNPLQSSVPSSFEATNAEHTSQPSSMPWYFQPTESVQYQLPHVQPHINPRFASAFGIPLPSNMGQWNTQQATPYYVPQMQQGWPWTLPGDGNDYTPK